MTDAARFLTIIAVTLLALMFTATLAAGIYRAFSETEAHLHLFRWLFLAPATLTLIPGLGLLLLAACERPR